MSERTIMFAVVAALLGAAFFFPYESDDDYYAKHQKKPPQQKQQTNAQQQDTNSREVETKAGVDARVAVDLPGLKLQPDPAAPGSGHGPADAADPGAAAPLADQVKTAENEIASKRGGLEDGQKLLGTWVEIFDPRTAAALASANPAIAVAVAAPPTTRPSVTTPANPATLTFNDDGTFSEHLLLTLDGEPIEAPRADYSGHYVLQGYTLSVIRTDPASRNDSTSTRKLDYIICPLGSENADGMPSRLYVDGKVLKLKSTK